MNKVTEVYLGLVEGGGGGGGLERGVLWGLWTVVVGVLWRVDWWGRGRGEGYSDRGLLGAWLWVVVDSSSSIVGVRTRVVGGYSVEVMLRGVEM